MNLTTAKWYKKGIYTFLSPAIKTKGLQYCNCFCTGISCSELIQTGSVSKTFCLTRWHLTPYWNQPVNHFFLTKQRHKMEENVLNLSKLRWLISPNKICNDRSKTEIRNNIQDDCYLSIWYVKQIHFMNLKLRDNPK